MTRLNPTSLGSLLVTLSLLFLYACSGGGFNAGDFRDRADRKALPKDVVRSLKLTKFASFTSNDSPSPAWSPDSERLVYSEQYPGRVIVFDLVSQSSRTIYDASTAMLPDIQYNVSQPAFLGNHSVITTGLWGGSINYTDAWTGAILSDVDNSTSKAFGISGSRAQVSADGDRVLFEASDGLILSDGSGQRLDTYPNLYYARWAPQGRRFAALRYANYMGESPELVIVDEDKQIEKLEAGVFQLAWDPTGAGLAYIRAGNRTVFDANWEFGSLSYYEFETKKTTAVASQARSPVFGVAPWVLFYETGSGLGISDLNESRVMRDLRLSNITVSPDGQYLSGVTAASGSPYGYYGAMDVTIYSIGLE